MSQRVFDVAHGKRFCRCRCCCWGLSSESDSLWLLLLLVALVLSFISKCGMRQVENAITKFSVVLSALCVLIAKGQVHLLLLLLLLLFAQGERYEFVGGSFESDALSESLSECS